MRLRFPIGLINIAASITGARGVARVNRDHRHTSKLRLVLKESSQFVKCPLSKLVTLRFSNRNPRAYAGEVFNRHGSVRVFSGANNTLGNNVVGIAFESALSAGHFFQVSFGRLRSFALEVLFELLCSLTNSIHLLTAMDIGIGIRSKIADAKVNAKIASWLKLGSVWQVNHKAEKESALAVNQVCLSENAALLKVGILAKDNRNLAPAINRENRSEREVSKREQSVVVDNRRVFLELVEGLFSCSVRFADLANCTNSELSRQAEPLSNIAVGQAVQGDLPKLLILKGDFRDVVTGIVELLHRPEKRLFLTRSRKQFNFHREFHRMDTFYHLFNVSAIADHRRASRH